MTVTERTINQSKLLERGWTKKDIEDHLEKGDQLPWNGRTLRVWSVSRVEEAERLNPVLARETAQRRAKTQDARAERLRQEQETKRAAAERERLARAEISLDRLRKEYDEGARRLEKLSTILGWSEDEQDISQMQPRESGHYCDEIGESFDKTMLFRLFSEGWRDGCKTWISWRYKDGTRAVAVLRKLAIPMDDILMLHIKVPEWHGDEIFTIRVDHHHAKCLEDFGECAKRYLYD